MTSWSLVRHGSIVAVALLTVVGCTSSEISALRAANASLPASTSLRTVPDTRDGLREVAHAYAHAWLAGTVTDIRDAAGSPCDSRPPGAMKRAEAALNKLRAGIKRLTGVAADSIKIRGVAVRNYTRSSAGAEVQYAVAKAGNDNWIPYKYARGRWNVADCTLLPIGGSSGSGSSTPPTTR